MPLHPKKIPGVHVVYADDLASVKMELPYGYDRLIHQSEYLEQPVSKRKEWVDSIAKEANEGAGIWVVTNDYYFMRLLQYACDKDKFLIHNLCSDNANLCTQIVTRFVDLKPNPTLQLAENIFRISAREALKRD